MTDAIIAISSTFTRLVESAGFVGADGFYVEGIITEETFRGSLQPLSSEDMQFMPAGFVSAGKMKLFVPESESILTLRDRVKDEDGVYWHIIDVQDYSRDGGYYRYMLDKEAV